MVNYWLSGWTRSNMMDQFIMSYRRVYIMKPSLRIYLFQKLLTCWECSVHIQPKYTTSTTVHSTTVHHQLLHKYCTLSGWVETLQLQSLIFDLLRNSVKYCKNILCKEIFLHQSNIQYYLGM